MYTISKLAKRFQLSRSTLLYYDAIGLLEPTTRTPRGYRLYSEADAERLEQICIYRQAGLPIAELKSLLTAEHAEARAPLLRRLDALNQEIRHLRQQQRLIMALLHGRLDLDRVEGMDKEEWVSLLRASGLGEQDMRRWHAEFEHRFPEKHRQFLEYLWIPEEERERIRRLARGEWRRLLLQGAPRSEEAEVGVHQVERAARRARRRRS